MKLWCDGNVVNYDLEWGVTSLLSLEINRLTSDYQSLSKFIVANYDL